ncbi:MAG: protein kinase, partial [Planctomycetota bacterium]|nr:protein kinase [Planctomycetota bacterium]
MNDDLKTNFKTWFPDLDPDTCDPSHTYKAEPEDSLLLTSTSLPGVSMSGDKTNPGLGSTIENESRDGAEDETEIFENTVPAESDEEETETGVVYQLGKVLGQGGMGIVYQARQVNLDRDVAVKCIIPEKARDERIRKKFTAEAQVVGLLDHPNIVPVHDLGKMAGDQILLAMKMVGGQEWSTIIRASHRHARNTAEENGKAAPRDKKIYDQVEHLKLLQSVCHAVEYAHSKGFVHLDLKPSNVMIGDYGEVYVMDWGVAAELKHPEGQEQAYRTKPVDEIRGPIGTPQYMSSEQAFGLGRKIGTWTDVYLLGAILHEILTNRPPHLGSKFLQVILAAQKSETPSFDSGVPKELAELCIHALKQDVDSRIQSVDEFRGRLEQYLNHRESLAISRVSDDLLSHCRASFEEMKTGAEEADRQMNESERNQLYDDFSETVNGFRQAQMLWQENKEAIVGEQTTRLVYAEAALFHNDIGLAEAQTAALERLGAPPKELKERIQQRKYEIESAARTAQLARYGLGFAAVLLTVVMTVAYFLVSDQKQLAERERDIAKDEKKKADIARDEAERARKESERQKTKALAAQKLEEVARLESEKQRAKAEIARGEAFLQYGNSLVAQGEALQLAKLDFAASRRYSRASEIFSEIGQSALPGDMPLWTLFRRSPPPILSIRASNSPIYSVSVSPTGRFLALGTGRGENQLWDILKGQKLKEWTGHKGTIRSIEFSPNGTQLVTGGIDDYVRCWTLKDQKVQWEFQGPENEVVSIQYLANGAKILVAPGDNVPVVLDANTGKLILKLEGHNSNVPCVAVTRDSRICLTVGFDRTMRVWDLATGKQLKLLRHELALNAVAVSPNGLYGASSGGDFVLRVWDLASEKIIATFPGHRGKVGRLIFSPDGRFLLSGSRDGTSRLWDIKNKREVQNYAYSTAQVEGIAWIPNTQLFVSAGRDGFWHLWKSQDQTIVKEFPFRGRLSLGSDVSDDGRLLAAGGVDRYSKSKQVVIKSFLQSPKKAWLGLRSQLEDTEIKNQVSSLAVWDIKTKQLLHEFDNKAGKVMDVAFSPNGRRLVSGGLSTQVWDVENAQLIKKMGENDLIYNVEFGLEGKKIYTAGYHVRVWD